MTPEIAVPAVPLAFDVQRARGLTYAEARDMLIHAFAAQVLDGVRLPPLRDALEAVLFEQLAKDLAEVDAKK